MGSASGSMRLPECNVHRVVFNHIQNSCNGTIKSGNMILHSRFREHLKTSTEKNKKICPSRYNPDLDLYFDI